MASKYIIYEKHPLIRWRVGPLNTIDIQLRPRVIELVDPTHLECQLNLGIPKFLTAFAIVYFSFGYGLCSNFLFVPSHGLYGLENLGRASIISIMYRSGQWIGCPYSATRSRFVGQRIVHRNTMAFAKPHVLHFFGMPNTSWTWTKMALRMCLPNERSWMDNPDLRVERPRDNGSYD